MARLEDIPEPTRTAVESLVCPAFDTIPFVSGPALAQRRVALVSSATVQADGPPPSARQIDRWFWRETVAGQMLLALRSMAMKSDKNALKTVGGRCFVPAPYLPA